MPAQPSAWRCIACGYVHRGSNPPEMCPACGASREDFEPFVEESAPSAVQAWRCLDCGFIHEGPRPPEMCPACGAPADQFEPVAASNAAVIAPETADRVLVIGAGIAGIAAIESLRTASPAAQITLVTQEMALPYYRLNLTRYLAGEVTEQDLPIHSADWYEQQRIDLRLGTQVRRLCLDDRAARLSDGQRLPFDKLLLAAGASPFVPPIPGADRPGVTTLRTVRDADAILEACRKGAKIVCIGGGILGLETAGALAHRGAEVTLLEGHGWLLPRQLNQRAGTILGDHVGRIGIQLRNCAVTREIVGDTQARGVRLADGNTLPADLVVIATGVRPNCELARQAGLEVQQGVVVNDRLETSHPGVYAAGDVAEHRGVVYGLWTVAQAQGVIAGVNLGSGAAEFGGLPPSNTLKVLGLDMFSIGLATSEQPDDRALEQEAGDRYFRFVFRKDYLIGAILLGDTSLSAAVRKAIQERRDCSALLRIAPTASAVLDYFRQ